MKTKIKKDAPGSVPRLVRDVIREAKKTEALVRRMSKAGAGVHEIASACGLTEDEVRMIL